MKPWIRFFDWKKFSSKSRNRSSLNLPFTFARRYLVSKKSSNAINIISWISIAGIFVGSLGLILVLSVFNGFEGLVISLYNSFNPDFTITANEGKSFIVD